MKYNVTLKPSPVETIEVTKAPNMAEYSTWYSPDFFGMEITITYKDGTHKVITLTEENMKYWLSNSWDDAYVTEVIVVGFMVRNYKEK